MKPHSAQRHAPGAPRSHATREGTTGTRPSRTGQPCEEGVGVVPGKGETRMQRRMQGREEPLGFKQC